MGIDVVDDHRDRNLTGYLILRSSSAAAKNAADVFKISFARRNSRTSRSSAAIRVASSVVVPGRTPPSTSPWRTQFRNASGWTPSWSAIRLIAPREDPGSFRASNAIRVARCCNSTLYFLGAPMTLIILPRIESLHHTRGDSQAQLDQFATLYNTVRPHRSLNNHTPAEVYTARAKATPSGHDGHWRIRHDKVDKTGRVTLRHASRLHHIGLGYEHIGTTVRILVHDLHITVINADTGELIRDLTLDPTRDYQPLGRPPGPPKGSPQRGGRKPPTHTKSRDTS